MEFERVGVVGCGLVGSGIAQVCAAAGYETAAREPDPAQLERALARVRDAPDVAVDAGKRGFYEYGPGGSPAPAGWPA